MSKAVMDLMNIYLPFTEFFLANSLFIIVNSGEVNSDQTPYQPLLFPCQTHNIMAIRLMHEKGHSIKNVNSFR